MLGMENMSGRMLRLGSGEIYFQEYVTPDTVLNRIDGVTPDEIKAVAGRLMNHENFSTVVIAPTPHRSRSMRRVA